MIAKKIIICAATVCLLGAAAFKTTTVYNTIIPQDLVTPNDNDIVKDGLVAWYTFNNGSLKDKSGNNNDIVFCNAKPTKDRFGKANNAYSFNGNGSYMKVSDSKSLNPKAITLMAVVNFNDFYTGPCNANQILKKGYQDQDEGIYGLRVTTLQDCDETTNKKAEKILGYYGNTQYDQTGAMVPDDFVTIKKWYNIIFTYDGQTAKIYVNGILKNKTEKKAHFYPNNNGLFIGRAENVNFPYWFNGIIDEVRIYKRAINEKEILYLQKLTK